MFILITPQSEVPASVTYLCLLVFQLAIDDSAQFL
jgi:hypothetical protein